MNSNWLISASPSFLEESTSHSKYVYPDSDDSDGEFTNWKPKFVSYHPLGPTSFNPGNLLMKSSFPKSY